LVNAGRTEQRAISPPQRSANDTDIQENAPLSLVLMTKPEIQTDEPARNHVIPISLVRAGAFG
jgi:hypothetical protein